MVDCRPGAAAEHRVPAMIQPLARRLLRALGWVFGGLLAVAVLLVALLLGAVLWVALLLFALGFGAWVAWRTRGSERTASGRATTVVVEGEYVVVQRARPDPMPPVLARERHADPDEHHDSSS